MSSPLSAAPSVRRLRSSFSVGALALSGAMLLGALGVQLLDAAMSLPLASRFASALLGVLAALCFVRATYRDANLFLFSPGFWLAVTVLFYFVLKGLSLWVKDEVTPSLVTVLWLTAVFLLCYGVGYSLTDTALRDGRRSANTPTWDVAIPRGGEWALLVVFGMFKLLGISLMARSGGGDALEVAAATQNAGAGYLYKIPFAANVICFALLREWVRHRRARSAAGMALLLYLVEAILNTSRLSIIILVLTLAFLIHRYRRPLSLKLLGVVCLPLVVVVVLFGYARNVEVGSAGAYVEAARVLVDEPALVSDLFLSRLDMLPEMEMAIDLMQSRALPALDGGSYVWSLTHSIPRTVWETKPLLTAALVTSHTHPGEFEAGVNIFPSLVVEGLLNFGIAGVLLNGLALGFVARQFERLLDSERLVPAVWGLSLLTFPMGLFNEGVHSNYVASILYTAFISWMLYRILLLIGALRRVRHRT
ncbi:O-antigen polymerase [Aquabacterium sp. J223]|uniref:O-antigen polymerase n=1 Tax=Aquabacterium sp. J223 TaxID=2898431 RepID=UPI0021ADFA2C|nr:O-antigen polymerase [Aquabacterium sp. J223]UUX96768.1 oligosaccharide repeat unit polymerase [Aquabacterium sp. J223]